MFVPKSKDEKKAEKAALKKVLGELRDWCMSCIPVELHEGLIIDVNEVACGDPSCAPIDTVFTLVWSQGGRGVFAIPLSANEIKQDDLIEFMPVRITVLSPITVRLTSMSRMMIFWQIGRVALMHTGRDAPRCGSKSAHAWNVG